MVLIVLGAGEQEGQGVGEGDAAAGTTVPAIDEGVLFKAEINKRLLELPQASAADSIEVAHTIARS